ncbi:uncharacterized protein SPPG_09045 [Spizellomyces punctatus DAOM BR117]|uniref:Nucleoporin NUP188 n=1 Tax=Spizellomyces punctatus (strain DAOM BR117) TaxID=645134 RepID=A0A0L0HML2_SPIPD|nr:uncharacterized protein SPPG_09045 [Spizellomyces punctatus DAOM BR117]KND02150.1 hypothetical protein SPPG_09045 [Spizellomyces punctatus DAOM BR117]|eukprot:XP_016610189.1 hypothetical protein SPPG_09045 [Spizellomyces punctatus DAOM BR117]
MASTASQETAAAAAAAASRGSTGKIRWTRKALWHAIENDREQIYTPEDFAANLAPHREALEVGVEWYKKPNAASRQVVEKRASAQKAQFVFKMSDLMDLDEVQCESILESCIKDDLEAPATKRRIDWSNMKTINYEDENLMAAVQQQYLNEREETLLALAALICTADDEDHRYHAPILAFVRELFPDSETTGQRLLDQLKKAVFRVIPSKIAAQPEWASSWAKQFVKEQRLLLQVIFLVYYSIVPCSPSSASAIITVLVQGFDMGKTQLNAALFDKETKRMVKHIADLSVMVVLEVMRLHDVLDVDAGAVIPLLESPEDICKIYKVITRKAQMDCTPGDAFGPILLGWGVLMSIVYPSLERKREEKYARLCDWIAEPSASDGPSPRLPQIFIQRAYVEYESIGYIISALKGTLTLDERMALGYKSVIKDMLMLLLETVEDPLHLPDRDGLINAFAMLFHNEDQLSLQWWEHDYETEEHRALLDAAARIFPVEFGPLIRLMTSLIGSPRSGAYVLRYMAALPSLADYFRPVDYVEVPYGDEWGLEFVYRWRGNPQGLVYGAQGVPFQPPAGTIAREVHKDPRVVLLQHTFSGWHLILSILDSFIHGSNAIAGQNLERYISGTIEAATEAVKLLNALFEHADETLMWEFIDHIRGITAGFSHWAEDTSDRFVGLICQVLNHACSFARPEMELLTSCMSCLSALLPYFPDAVWKHLRSEILFPRHSPSAAGAALPTNSYMEEVVLPAEVAIGQYPTTLAFLDFVSAMIREAQTLRQQEWALNETQRDLEAQFWAARRNPQLMPILEAQLGGPERRKDLERKVLAQARLRESAALKSEVLFSAVVYVHSEIFPKHGTWRYVRIHDKHRIGLKVLQIFNQIMWDSTWASSERPGEWSGVADFRIIQEYLTRSYLVDGSVYQIAPLIDFVSLGSDVPLRFYRSLRMKTARVIEECIEHSLRFIKYLLKRRKISGLKVSLLEHSLLDRTVHNGTQNDAIELVQVIGRYISYENHRPLPLLATEVLTLLCAVAGDWQPRPPSLAGYFGVDAYNFVASIVKLIGRDTSPYEELQTALYNFITEVVVTQPGLAAMLLTGEASRPLLPSSVRGLLSSSVQQEPSNGNTLSKLSVLSPALTLLQSWRQILETQPTTLPAAMRLMDALWQNAPKYMGVLDKLRSQPVFWQVIGNIFDDVPEMPSDEPVVTCVEGTASREQEDIRRFAYSKQVRTYTLRILAFEIYFTHDAKESQPILRIAKKIFEQKGLFTDDSTLPYLSELPERVKDLAASLGLPVALSSYKRLSWSDDLDVDQQFGDAYVYDLDLLRGKLYGHIHFRAAEGEEEIFDAFLSAICAVNHNRSITDAHMYMVKAWKTFIKVLTATFTAAPTSRTGPALSISPDHLSSIIRQLTDILMEEHRDDATVIAYRSEISDLLLFLIAVWGDLKRKPVQNEVAAKEVVDILGRLFRCMATEYYELGPPGTFSEFPFHIDLVSAIVVALRILRGSASPETLKGMETRRIFQDILPVICRGLSLLLKGLGEDDYRGHKWDVSLALSCLSELISFNETIYPGTGISIMDRYEIFPLLLVMFQRAATSSPNERTFADDVLPFMKAIAETPLGAERLANEGIFICFTNNSFTPELTQGAVLPYVGQERNPGHRMWCSMLSIVSSIVQVLGHSPVLLEEATGFIRVYRNQIGRALDVAADGDLTLGRVEEIMKITEFFYGLASWGDQAKTQSKGEASYFGAIKPFLGLELQLLAYFAYLFENPHEMHRRIVPVSRAEKDGATTPSGRSRSDQPQAFIKARQAEPNNAGGVEGGKDRSNVHFDAIRIMILVVRNIIAYLRLAANADEAMVKFEESDPQRPNLFQPTMSLHGAEAGATMGTLFDLIRRVTTIFRNISESNGSSQETANVQQSLEYAARNVSIADLVLIAESGLVLAATQIARYKRYLDADDVLSELVGELEPTIKDIGQLLADAKNRDQQWLERKGWNQMEIERIIAFIKRVDDFAASEFGRGM